MKNSSLAILVGNFQVSKLLVVLLLDVAVTWNCYISMDLEIPQDLSSVILHLTPCCYVLDCLRSLFAQPTPGILSDVADPSLYCSGAQGLFLSCHD